MLNSAYLYQQIPVEIRPFFKIEMADIPSQYANLLDTLLKLFVRLFRLFS